MTAAYKPDRGDTAIVACTTSYSGLRPVARDCTANFVYMWFNSSWLVASMANDLPEVAYQAMRFCMVIEEPEDYCDTFEGRGQQEQDWHNLANGQGD